MEHLAIFGIAIGLAMDAFAVSIGLGLCGGEHVTRRALKVAVAFGGFQTGMTLAGYGVGWMASGAFLSASHWISAGILWAVSLHMFVGALKKRDPECDPACAMPGETKAGDKPPLAPQQDSARGFMLIALSVATSLDAFAVGMSMALIASPIWWASATIGVVAAVLSFAGVSLACRIVAAVPAVSKVAELSGAVVIALIGVKAALDSSM